MNNKTKLRRLVWTAFNTSRPMGMGFLHANTAAKLNEDTFLSDEAFHEGSDGSLSVYADYLCGRMMKTDFKVSKDGTLTVNPEIPRGDYQSWAGRFASGAEMVAEAEASLEPSKTAGSPSVSAS